MQNEETNNNQSLQEFVWQYRRDIPLRLNLDVIQQELGLPESKRSDEEMTQQDRMRSASDAEKGVFETDDESDASEEEKDGTPDQMTKLNRDNIQEEVKPQREDRWGTSWARNGYLKPQQEFEGYSEFRERTRTDTSIPHESTIIDESETPQQRENIQPYNPQREYYQGESGTHHGSRIGGLKDGESYFDNNQGNARFEYINEKVTTTRKIKPRKGGGIFEGEERQDDGGLFESKNTEKEKEPEKENNEVKNSQEAPSIQNGRVGKKDNFQFKGYVNKASAATAGAAIGRKAATSSVEASEINARFAKSILRADKKRGFSRNTGRFSDEPAPTSGRSKYLQTQDVSHRKSIHIMQNSTKFKDGQAPMPGYNAIRPQYSNFKTGYSDYYENTAYSVGKTDSVKPVGAYSVNSKGSTVLESNAEAEKQYAHSIKQGIRSVKTPDRLNESKINQITGRTRRGVFGISEYESENGKIRKKRNSEFEKKIDEKSQNRAASIVEEEFGRNKSRTDEIDSTHVRLVRPTDTSKMNTKTDALSKVAASRISANRGKNIKILAKGIALAAPGAGMAAGKINMARGQSVYGGNNPGTGQPQADDGPEALQEGGGLRKKKGKKQPKKKKPKFKTRITAGVLAMMIAATGATDAMEYVSTDVVASPAMATVQYDATGENPDSMTQAAYAILKSRFEAIKGKILYGEDYEFQDESSELSSGLNNGDSVLNNLVPWQGTRYEITDREALEIARVCKREQGSEDGVVLEINQMLNLYELGKSAKYSNGNKTDGTGVWTMLREDRWYNPSKDPGLSKRTMASDNGTTPSMVDSVKKAMRDGVRYLPLYVNEHDWIGDIEGFYTDSSKSTRIEQDACVRNKSYVQQNGRVGGGHYTYFITCKESSDPFGYTDDAPAKARALGWHDEITDGGNITQENTYIGGNMGTGAENAATTNYGFYTLGNSKSGTDLPTDGNFTVEDFVEMAGEVMEWARTTKTKHHYDFCTNINNPVMVENWSHVPYGPSTSKVPCDDKYISCDRLIARTLYKLGVTDQPEGGIHLHMEGGMGNWLKQHGWQESHDLSAVKYGSIVMYKLSDGRDDWRHTFVALSHDPSTHAMDRYDAGSNAAIEKKQPLKKVPLRNDISEIAIYNWPGAAGNVYDGSLNLPDIKCTRATVINEDGASNELNDAQKQEIAANGVMNFKYETKVKGTVYSQKEVVDTVKFKKSKDAVDEDQVVADKPADIKEIQNEQADPTGGVDPDVVKQIKELSSHKETELVIPSGVAQKINEYKSKHPLAVVKKYYSHMETINAAATGNAPAGAGSNTGKVIMADPKRPEVGTTLKWGIWDRDNWLNDASIGSKAEQLCRDFCNFDEDGFGRIGEYYVAAMTKQFGEPGDIVKVSYKSGLEITVVICDIKNEAESDVDEWGHDYGANMLEFYGNGHTEGFPNWNSLGNTYVSSKWKEYGWYPVAPGDFEKAEVIGNVWVDGVQSQSSNDRPSLTVKFIGKQRGSSATTRKKYPKTDLNKGNFVQNWGVDKKYWYDMYNDKIASDQITFYDEENYFQMLMNALTIGTGNADPKWGDEGSKDMIEYLRRADPDCFNTFSNGEEDKSVKADAKDKDGKKKKVKLKAGNKRIKETATLVRNGKKVGMKIDVPYISQTGAHCGPTSLAMAFSYLENYEDGQFDPSLYNESAWFDAYGHGDTGFIACATKRGYEHKGYNPASPGAESWMVKKLDKGLPIVISFNSGGSEFASAVGHFDIITGYVRKNGKPYFIVQDPNASRNARVSKSVYTIERLLAGRLNGLHCFVQKKGAKSLVGKGVIASADNLGLMYSGSGASFMNMQKYQYGPDDHLKFVHLNVEDELKRIKEVQKKWEEDEEKKKKGDYIRYAGDAAANKKESYTDDERVSYADTLPDDFHVVDERSSYLAKMGYLQYACDLMDATFQAIKKRGFEVTYKIGYGNSTTSWSAPGGIAIAPSTKMTANVTIYVDASPDDYIKILRKLGNKQYGKKNAEKYGGQKFTADDIMTLYGHYAEDSEEYKRIYKLEELVPDNAQLGGTGGMLAGTARDVYKYFHNKGLSDICIAGIIGNMAIDAQPKKIRKTGEGKFETITTDENTEIAEDSDTGSKKKKKKKTEEELSPYETLTEKQINKRLIYLLDYRKDKKAGKKRRIALKQYIRKKDGRLGDLRLQDQLDFIWDELFAQQTGESMQVLNHKFTSGGRNYSYELWGETGNPYWGTAGVNSFQNSMTPEEATKRFYAWAICNGHLPNERYKEKFPSSAKMDKRVDEALRAYQLIIGNSSTNAGNDYIKFAEMMASDSRVGYDQGARRFCHNGGDNLDTDCSSFVFYALYYTGYLSDLNPSDPFTTGSMGSALISHGFTQIPASQAQRGDIFVTSGEHTEICTGDGETIGSHEPKDGGPGDHGTGKEVCYAHYVGAVAYRYSGPGPSTPPELPIQLVADQDPR